MSKKNSDYMFILGGRALEHPSLVELRMDAESDQWDMIVSETIDFYLQMDAIHKTNPSMIDKKDLRILRSIKRSLEFIRTLDSATYNKYYTLEAQDKYKKMAQEEVKNIESLNVSYSDKPDANSDITVIKPRTNPNSIIISGI